MDSVGSMGRPVTFEEIERITGMREPDVFAGCGKMSLQGSFGGGASA